MKVQSNKFVYLFVLFNVQLNYCFCDISSILFPFNIIVDQNSIEKKNEPNTLLRNRNLFKNNGLNKLNFRENNYYLNSDADQFKDNQAFVMADQLYCEKEEWLCKDNLRCVLKISKCDNKQDCIDNSDEEDCENHLSSIRDEFTKIINKQNLTDKNIDYDAPYLKVFPLKPISNQNQTFDLESGYSNFAILTNNENGKTDKLLRSLGFDKISNNSTNSQEVSSVSKIIKLSKAHDIIKDKKEFNSTTYNLNDTSTKLNKNNTNSNKVSFSINVPSITLKNKSSIKPDSKKPKNPKKDLNKKDNCSQKPNSPECKHCSYGLFRCTKGKCVITSFDCNANGNGKGRRVTVDSKDFIQFI